MSKKDKKNKDNKNLSGSVTFVGNTGIGGFALGNTSTTSTFVITYTKNVESTRFVEDEKGNYFEVISQEVPSHYIHNGSWTTTPTGRTMVKDIYGIKDGKIQIINTVRGIEQPGYYVEPSIDWEE